MYIREKDTKYYNMSDREGASGAAALDDELSLPKATVSKMISGARLCIRSLDPLFDPWTMLLLS